MTKIIYENRRINLNREGKEGHTRSPTWQTSSHPVTTGYGVFLSWALLFPFFFPVDDGTLMVELRLMRQACSPAAAAAANFLRAGMSTWGNAVDIVLAWIRWNSSYVCYKARQLRYVQETWVSKSHRTHGMTIKMRYPAGKADGLSARNGGTRG